MKISIVIPNFNGQELLQKNLSSVLKLKADEVIIVDDASKDDSVTTIKTQFSQIQLLEHKQNTGYGQSVNDGMQAASGDVVLLLNTDTTPQEDCLAHLLPYFEKDKIFAVSCHEPGHAWASGSFRNGFFYHRPGQDISQPHISLYASGGSAAFSRQKFIDLGLYDPLFRPFYWEDTDISYRAWKRGWEVWWEPKAVVVHETSSTIRKYFSQSYRDYIVQRNELFFNWKNITDDSLFRQHKVALIRRLMTHPGYFRPLLGAIGQLSAVRKRRRIEIEHAMRTDQEIFDMFAMP